MNKLQAPVWVPFGWLVAIIGAAASALGGVFLVGVWVASITAQVSAQGEEIAELKQDDLPARLVRVETILDVTFPNQAKEADRRLAAKQRRRP